jgi:hypothetical protein
MKRPRSTQPEAKKGKVMENQINSQVQQFYQFWKSAAAEQAAFLESFYQELGKVQTSAVAQFNANFDEAVRLGKQALEQGQQIVSQWRKLAVEAARKAADAAIPTKA